MIDWLESRTGLVSFTKRFLTEDVPGGASYWYVFGSSTLIVLTIQIITGIVLTFYYSPSALTAWESTLFIYQHVFWGSFLISLHSWGASAMIVLMSMHLLQVLLFGAYKKPRELQWVVGVLLFFIVLSMGLTGYLLPWDLNAYFATQVAINIAASVPFIGPFIYHFLSDGSTLGTLTIGRFYGLHVWATPAVIVALVSLHLFIFKHNGSAGAATDEPPKIYGRFYPNQIFMESMTAFVVVAIIVALAIVLPTPLLAKADPNNAQFIPAPAWYFYALYGLLRIFPQNLALVPTVILPGAFTLLLLLLPWLDRNPRRVIARRPYLVTFAILTVGVIVGTTIYSQKVIAQEQAASPVGQTPVVGYGAPPTVSAENAIPIVSLQVGAPVAGPAGAAPGGGAAVVLAAAGAETVYAQNCASCHGAQGQGVPGAVAALAGNPYVIGDPNDVIATVLNGRTGPLRIKGVTYNGLMPAWKDKLSPAEIAAVITFIRSSWGNNATPVTEAQVKALSK
jgi:ubiquinol-cytochrome c reductase cytochrome b subunit